MLGWLWLRGMEELWLEGAERGAKSSAEWTVLLTARVDVVCADSRAWLYADVCTCADDWVACRRCRRRCLRKAVRFSRGKKGIRDDAQPRRRTPLPTSHADRRRRGGRDESRLLRSFPTLASSAHMAPRTIPHRPFFFTVKGLPAETSRISVRAVVLFAGVAGAAE